MDGCGVSKAVLIGMPCCKKWSKDEPERPLYYQDDNAQCYVYAYSDQMVADAWLALEPDQRTRCVSLRHGRGFYLGLLKMVADAPGRTN